MKKQAGRKPLYAKHGKEIDALAVINQTTKKLDILTDTATFKQAGIEISITHYAEVKGNVGINIHKLLKFATSKFDGKSPEVNFPLGEYMAITGNEIPTEREQRRRKKNEMQKRIRKELYTLQSVQVRNVNENGFESISPVCRTAAKNGNITIEFSRPFAEYLQKKRTTKMHSQLLKISGRSPTAYAIGFKCTDHFYMNLKRQTQAANRLKVKNILKSTPLPDYEKVLADRRSWKDRIKQPFEKAMNELVSAGVLLSWQYETPICGSSYHTFADTMIRFEVAELE